MLNLFLAYSRTSTKHLLPFMDRMAPKWYKIGVMLLETEQQSQLKLIQARHGSNLRMCCLAMFQYWMGTHPRATWHHVVAALRSPGVELSAVASDLERNFTGKNLL